MCFFFFFSIHTWCLLIDVFPSIHKLYISSPCKIYCNALVCVCVCVSMLWGDWQAQVKWGWKWSCLGYVCEVRWWRWCGVVMTWCVLVTWYWQWHDVVLTSDMIVVLWVSWCVDRHDSGDSVDKWHGSLLTTDMTIISIFFQVILIINLTHNASVLPLSHASYPKNKAIIFLRQFPALTFTHIKN